MIIPSKNINIYDGHGDLQDIIIGCDSTESNVLPDDFEYVFFSEYH